MKLMLVSAALAAFALPAAASPGVEAFKAVCGDTHANFDAIKTALAGPDWKVAAAQPNALPGVTPTESIARGRVAGDIKVTVNAWKGAKGDYQMTACTVRVSKIAVKDAASETQAWVGFAPESSAADKTTWRYGETAGVRAAVQKDAYETAAKAAGLFFLNVFADNDEAVIDLLKIKS